MLNQGRINDPTLAWGIPNPWEGVEVRGLGSVGSTQYSGASRISYGGAILDWLGGGGYWTQTYSLAYFCRKLYENKR